MPGGVHYETTKATQYMQYPLQRFSVPLSQATIQQTTLTVSDIPIVKREIGAGCRTHVGVHGPVVVGVGQVLDLPRRAVHPGRRPRHVVQVRRRVIPAITQWPR